MNQLLWYYAELEKQKCLDDTMEMGTDGKGAADFVVGASRRKSQVEIHATLKLFCHTYFV